MKQLPFLLALGGFCIGLVITLSFLSGDDEGRVNLLYLLLLFVFIPVAGFILSLLSLVLPLGRGLAESVIEIPIWPKQWRRELPGMEMTGIRRAWFFYLSQLLALSLGLGCLIGFFVILLVNDVSFVWRSTVLAASDLLPLLRFLALPWTFWHEAQPSLTLLQLSQDFRLGEPNTNALVLGQWWKYAPALGLLQWPCRGDQGAAGEGRGCARQGQIWIYAPALGLCEWSCGGGQGAAGEGRGRARKGQWWKDAPALGLLRWSS